MFIIEGNIGVGKSTFLRLLQQHLAEVSVIQEAVGSWEAQVHGQSLLTNFYVEPMRWAYTFELLTLISRFQENKGRVHNMPGITVMERSVYSGYYCFAKNSYQQGFLTDAEWCVYQEWFEFLVSQSHLYPLGFIYLRISPQTAYERTKKRNRDAEKTVSLEYLKQIHGRHEEFLIEQTGLISSLKQVPVLVLDCEEEFEADAQKFTEHMQKVENFCTNVIGQYVGKNVGATHQFKGAYKEVGF